MAKQTLEDKVKWSTVQRWAGLTGGAVDGDPGGQTVGAILDKLRAMGEISFTTPAAPEEPAPDVPTLSAFASKYAIMARSMVIRPSWEAATDSVVGRLRLNRSRYQEIERKTGVPWEVVATIHELEAGQSFKTHLHNGDSLNERTRQVPRGRPKTGAPPFTWEESAVDALAYDGLDKLDWPTHRTVPTVFLGFALDALERFNGLGYRKKGIASPYLWSGTQYYSAGKYVADGKFDPNAVSRQLGAAPILKSLLDFLN